MCEHCRRESVRTMQFSTLDNGSDSTHLYRCELSMGDNTKLVPLNSDRFYSTNNNELKPSRRIQTIQRKIDCLRECNYLLINQIRKVCDSTYMPTKSDFEYLNQLFEVDQLHVQDLSDSLARGKRAIDRSMQEACKDSDYGKCKALHLRSIHGCETGYIMEDFSTSTHSSTQALATCRDLHQKNLHNRHHCSSPPESIIKGSCLKFEECHKHDLSEMEKELRRMKQRLEKLNKEHECKDGKCLDFPDDAADSLHCTNNCNSKNTREKSHKVVQRSRCIIS